MTTSDKLVKTRKKHRCRVCNEVIEIGEAVSRRSGIDWDGPFTIHMHPECKNLTKQWNQDDWEGFSPGELKRPTK